MLRLRADTTTITIAREEEMAIQAEAAVVTVTEYAVEVVQVLLRTVLNISEGVGVLCLVLPAAGTAASNVHMRLRL